MLSTVVRASLLSMLMALVLCVGLPKIADAQTYSQSFTHNVSYPPASIQSTSWSSFRASLPSSGVTSITISGSLDPVGRTCNDPIKAQQIADALRAGSPSNLQCNSSSWATGFCGAGLELTVANSQNVCSCVTGYTVRPDIQNSNWGGIGATCGAPSQNLNVSVSSAVAAPTVASVSPSTGPTGGGTPITITGAHLTGASSVTIGGAAATNVTVVNDTTITATTPLGSVGPGMA